MKTATVRDLRYHFPAVEAQLREGETIKITKHKKVIARLVPESLKKRRRPPDFPALWKKLYGDKVFEVTGAKIVSQQREPY
jgi:antitoxin (DNA-binding transcriptional repressor) of toxin-antitoxin stability system